MSHVKIVQDKVFVKQGEISSADITGTAAGQLGHANGYPLVASGGADEIVELVSCTLINEFDTAAYTAGGNTTVNISGGGAALTGLVANSAFIQAATDAIIQFVPLAATIITHTADTGLNLVSASAPTNPGTAAGKFRYVVRYRRTKTQL